MSTYHAKLKRLLCYNILKVIDVKMRLHWVCSPILWWYPLIYNVVYKFQRESSNFSDLFWTCLAWFLGKYIYGWSHTVISKNALNCSSFANVNSMIIASGRWHWNLSYSLQFCIPAMTLIPYAVWWKSYALKRCTAGRHKGNRLTQSVCFVFKRIASGFLSQPWARCLPLVLKINCFYPLGGSIVQVPSPSSRVSFDSAAQQKPSLSCLSLSFCCWTVKQTVLSAFPGMTLTWQCRDLRLRECTVTFVSNDNATWLDLMLLAGWRALPPETCF